MSNHRVQNIFIGNGTALPANNGAISATTPGKIGIYGADFTALDPAGNDTVTTQPAIHIVECNTDSDSVDQYKISPKIKMENVIAYNAESYTPSRREVWAIGHNRKTNTGTIEVANSTVYTVRINFKHDKSMGSVRPDVFTISFTSAAAATQSSIATQIANAINNTPGWKNLISAIVVGDGTGVYGVTAATDFGVEITGKDVNQFSGTNFNNVKVYFSVHVDDNTGFGTTSTCTQIQAMSYGSGTYEQVRIMENLCFGYEGVLNRTKWPIPELDYSSVSTYVLSAVIGVNTTTVIGEDQVVYASTIAAIIRPGEKVEIEGVNYEVKYIKGDGTGTTGGNEVVLCTVASLAEAAGDVTKIRVQYDLVTIDYTDNVITPTGFIAMAPKSVIIAMPALDAGDAYNGISAGSQDLMDILNPWMLGTPKALANISI